MMRIDHLDHLVLTVENIDRTCAFYTDVLGMQVQSFEGGRKALGFGRQKINLHQKGAEFEPKAFAATPGSSDLCFIASTPLSEVMDNLARHGIAIVEGPAQRTGASGTIRSVYIRDPDLNLIEISNPLTGAAEEAAGDILPARLPTGAALPSAALGAGAAGALAVGSTAAGALALGAAAVGALAIGWLAIGRLSIGNARIKRLEIDELVVGRREDDRGER